MLGVLLLGATAAPALAEEAGVITKQFGNDLPTEMACNDRGRIEQARQSADAYACYRQANNRWDGYLMWYT